MFAFLLLLLVFCFLILILILLCKNGFEESDCYKRQNREKSLERISLQCQSTQFLFVLIIYLSVLCEYVCRCSWRPEARGGHQVFPPLHSVETGPAMTSGRVASVYHHIHFYIWVLGSELSPHACSVNTVCTLAGLEFSSFHILGSLVLGCHM